jgi:outer membrane protein assembly factor BamB
VFGRWVALLMALLAGCVADRPAGTSPFLLPELHCPSANGKVVNRPCLGRIPIGMFQVTRGGEVSIGSGATGQLPVPREGRIEMVYATQLGHDYLLVYQASNGESGWGGAARLDRHGAARWHHAIPGFNVGNPLVEDDRLYVSAFGYLAALSLETGELIWEHAGLYSPDENAFIGFSAPVISDLSVLFQELYGGRQGPLRTYGVDRETGHLSEQ